MGCAASKSTAVSMAPAKSDDGPGREFASATDKPLRSRRFLAAHFLHSPAELATTCPPKPARCRAIPEAGGKTPPRAEGAATSRGGTTPATDSLTSLETASSHSRHNSAVGLDKMIDEKRGAKNMSERVVHIEVPFGKPIEEVYDGVHDGPVLGTGISGQVRLVSHKATGLQYAVKCLDLGLVDTEEGLRQLREEIYIMCQLDHPNIIRLEEVYESHSAIYLVQELCLGGELFDRLDEQPDYHYTEAQCARLVTQMLSSVRYIHSKGIIHRDLKLENFLFTDTSPDSELKMIDFGLSKHFKSGEVQREAVGTPYTVAPEVIRGIYDERCDVWAIGVITYLLLSGDSPFGGCGGPESLIEVRQNIINCNYKFEPEDIWENVSDNAKQFIRNILVTDVSMRPTAREVQKNAWLAEVANGSKGVHDRALNPSVVSALVNFKEYSYMRKLLCEVLSFTLIPDQIQGLRQEFEKIDTEGSGEISLSALKTVLLGNAAQGSLGALSEKEVEDIFDAMRVGSTETTIHWHEFIAAGLSHCKVDERNLKLAFDRLDADHTGFITFDNVMDLIGNCAEHSEEVLRQMWGEASVNSSDAHITYEDFLLLMNGHTKPNPMTAAAAGKDTNAGAAVKPVSLEGGFMSPIVFDDKTPEAPICIDAVDDIQTLDQATLVKSKAPVFLPGKEKSKSFDYSAANPAESSPLQVASRRDITLADHNRNEDSLNFSVDDKPKTNLVVHRELYRAHRSMRLAVLEASKRLEEERQRRAREEMRKEHAKSSSSSAGLVMRHGGELSAEAIQQFVVQKQEEEREMVQKAAKRAGRRHCRKKTSSDIRGMFGGSDSGMEDPSSSSQRCITRRGTSSGRTLSPMAENTGQSRRQGSCRPPSKEHPLLQAASPEAPTVSDLADVPIRRKATTPGQFRKTSYDPFSFASKGS